MEQLLLKLVKQLDSLDEASLAGLWEKYVNIVSRFEPSDRWQEAVLVLSFIQAKRWKNQLFNTKWSTRTKNAASGAASPPQIRFTLECENGNEQPPQRKAKVLPFAPHKEE